MDKYLRKFKGTNYVQCIIKEELIISDDEKSDDVDVKDFGEAINESFLDTNIKHNEPNGTAKVPIKRKRSERLRNEKDDKSTLNSFIKTENSQSTNQLEHSNNVKNDEKPGATVEAAKSDDMDTLYKQFAKSHCHKCNVKRAVIRQKARCRKCKAQLAYSCETCNKTYGSFTQLGSHLKKQHTSQIHPCPVCNKVFSYRKGMLVHRRNQHGYVDESGAVVQRCAKCGKIFKSKHVRAHEKVCGEEAPHKCHKCPYVTFHKSSLSNHMIEKHTDFKKKCENCDKVFTNPRSMKRHSRVYCNKVKRIECHHCGHKFYRRDQVLNHLDRAHFGGSLTGNLLDDSQVPRICKYCDTTLDQYEWMRTHLERCESAPLSFRRRCPPHDDYDGSYRNCKYCGTYLQRYEKMRYHLERCESAPPDCQLENERADQPDLETALKNLSKTYCENCNTKRPMKKGQRRCKKCETSLKFICVRCPKSFNQTHQLLDHLRVKHVKNKTFYHCDKCNRYYSLFKHLNVHKKTHHPSKPTTKIFKCSKCGKIYHNEPSIRKHGVSCGMEPKFSCDKCPYKTHFKSSLVEHFRAKRSTCI